MGRAKNLTERQKSQRAHRREFWAAKAISAKTPEDKAVVAFAEARARINDLQDIADRDHAWWVLAEQIGRARDIVLDLLPPERR